jgi:signal transduction histidine kinase
MRKAFDANVPKLKPRLKSAAVVVSEVDSDTPAEHSPTPENTLPGTKGEFTPGKRSKAGSEPAATKSTESEFTSETDAEAIIQEIQSVASLTDPSVKKKVSALLKEATQELPEAEKTVTDCLLIQDETENSTVTPEPSSAARDVPADGSARRERLEKIKRKVTDAARSGIRIEPVSEDPVQATESILGLVSDLETQLSRSRNLEKALRIDLSEAKTELTRTVTEGRMAAERLVQAETQLDENRKVLEEMLHEMSILEEERDQAVRRVQILTTRDGDQQKLFDDLKRSSAELEEALSESKIEEDRLLKELEESVAENVRLRTLLAEVTQERDMLVRNVEHLSKDREEQIQAKKALEKVHKALAQARARLV